MPAALITATTTICCMLHGNYLVFRQGFSYYYFSFQQHVNDFINIFYRSLSLLTICLLELYNSSRLVRFFSISWKIMTDWLVEKKESISNNDICVGL